MSNFSRNNRFQIENERRICAKCGEIFWAKKKSKNKICTPCKEGWGW